MEFLEIICWASSGVAVSCWLIIKRANAEIDRIRVQAQQEVSYARAEAARARIRAAQFKLEIDAWKAGHAQGRHDVISALPLLAARHEPANHDPATCGCQPAAQMGNGA